MLTFVNDICKILPILQILEIFMATFIAKIVGCHCQKWWGEHLPTAENFANCQWQNYHPLPFSNIANGRSYLICKKIYTYIILVILGPFSRGYCLKVNSVKEACAKCFSVHKLKFEILQITWKKWNKEHKTLSFQFFTNRFSILMSFVLFFMWFVRLHILISEPQSIWRKLLVLSWL